MVAPQLSVRSGRARDLAHRLSAREKRPIHAIVEDALEAYADKTAPQESAGAFLRRMRSLGVPGAVDDLNEALAGNRRPHDGIDL